MPLITVDALPSGQVLINTDHVILARTLDGTTTIYMVEGYSVDVPHESARRLHEEMSEAAVVG